MLLCEQDDPTVTALDTWYPPIQALPRCKRAKVVKGDWRDRFARGLPRPWQVGLPERSLTLVSFDPNRIAPDGEDGGVGNPNLYGGDLDLAIRAMGNLNDPVIVQLSTYPNRHQPNQLVVEQMVRDIFVLAGFENGATVRVPAAGNDPHHPFRRDMMSFVYARGVPWAMSFKH